MRKLALMAAAAMAVAGTPALAAPTFADIVSIVDESGSMAGEHAWLGGMVGSLDTRLIAAGLTAGNNFGLVGFGGGGAGNSGRQINVGGGQFGTSAQYATATGSLVTSGGTEDGYAGINFANGYTYRAGAARNYILVTDEDRDNTNAALTYASILASLSGSNTLLNAVVNASFTCDDGGVGAVLGVHSGGLGYRADGLGGFIAATNCILSTDFGTTDTDYVNLALASGGGAWDLNRLRAGGNTATSFTAAFIDLKVAEITRQGTVPEPATLALVGAALAAIGAARRRKPA